MVCFFTKSSLGLTLHVLRQLDTLSEPWALTHHMDTSILLFRGTANLDDLRVDTRFALHPLKEAPHARVHAGFLHRYEELRRTLPSAHVSIVAGHSLGAALATLHMQQLATSASAPVPHCMLFASPRVGDSAFAEHFDRLCGPRTVSLLNTRDPVVHLPPDWRYRHVAWQTRFVGPIGGHAIEVYEEEVKRRADVDAVSDANRT